MESEDRLSYTQTDERGEEHQPRLADDTVVEGNPPPASLTFSSAPHCITMPVPFTSFTVKGIPLHSGLVTPASSHKLHNISLYPAVFEINCWHCYFQMGRIFFFPMYFMLRNTNCKVFNCFKQTVQQYVLKCSLVTTSQVKLMYSILSK